MPDRERTITAEAAVERDAEADRDGPTRPPAEAGPATCALCEQRVPAAETVAVAVDDAPAGTLCEFCAASLFADGDAGAGAGAGADADAGAPGRPTATREGRGGGSDVRADADAEVRTGVAPAGPADDADGAAAARPRPRRASAVRWAPAADGRGPEPGGVLGTLLRAHRLSLSLLWAIHRTNVRLTERVLDEVDVQTLALVAILASTLVWVVAAV